MLGLMLVKFEESGLVLLLWVISIAKIVQKLRISLLNQFDLLIRVFASVRVELASCCFSRIRFSGVSTHLHNLIDSSLRVRAFNRVNIE